MKKFLTSKDKKRSPSITEEVVVRNNKILNSYFGIPPYLKRSASYLGKKYGLNMRYVRKIIADYRERVESAMGVKYEF